MRTVAVAALGLMALSRGASAGCPKSLDATIASHLSAKRQAIARCEDARSRGSIPATVNCRPTRGVVTDPATAGNLAALDGGVAAALDDCTSLPPVGFACDAAGSPSALAACIAGPVQEPDTAPASADQLIDLVYATPAPIADAGVRACQSGAGREGGRYVRDRTKLLRRCRLRGGRPCPDARTVSALARARERFVKRVHRRCTEAAAAVLAWGPPCNFYREASYARSQDPVRPNDNALPLNDRLIGCLADAHAGVADRSLGIAYPDAEPVAFPLGVAGGDATEDAAVFWTAVADASAPVTLEVATDPLMSSLVATVPGLTPGIYDTVKADVADLAPATTYWYRFRQGGAASRIGRIVTLPPSTQPAVVRLGWGSALNAYHRPFTVLAPLATLDLDAFLLVGDTIQADDTRADGVAARVDGEYLAKHRSVRADGPLRDLLAATGTYAQWDDGEVSVDWAGTLDVLAPRILVAGRTFTRHYPLRELPGGMRPQYRRVRFGTAVELFILDTRSYRSLKYTCCNDESHSGFVVDDVEDVTSCISLDAQQDLATPNCLASLADPGRTVLGAAQRAWLEAALLESTAIFKLVVSGPPMSEMIVDRYDRWEGWLNEREVLLEHIQGHAIPNVIVLSHDLGGMFLADVRVDATHRVPEVVTGAVGDDSWLRAFFPARLLPFFQGGVIPSLVTHLTAWEVDRPIVTTITVDPTSLPATARFDFYDRTGVPVRSHTFAAVE